MKKLLALWLSLSLLLLSAGCAKTGDTSEISDNSAGDEVSVSEASNETTAASETEESAAASLASADSGTGTGSDTSELITGEEGSTEILIKASDYAEYGSDTAVLQKAINSATIRSSVAANSGSGAAVRLQLDDRTYTLSGTLNFTNSQNIIVDGNGATLVWTEIVTAFVISNCTNVTFENMSLDYDPLPFTQGVVTAVSGMSVSVKIDDGYPCDLSQLKKGAGSGNVWSNIHDRSTGGIMEGTPTSIAFTPLSVSGRTIKLAQAYVSDNGTRPIQAGDVLTLYYRSAGTVTVTGSEGLAFTNFNIYSSHGFAYNESNGNGGTVLTNFNVIPGETPAGATQARLMSANADGTHFGNLKTGPTFDGCAVTHCGDDCVNMQGFFMHVLAVVGNTIIVSPKWDTPLTVGDTIEGYTADGYDSVGTATITNFVSKNDAAYQSAILASYAGCDTSIASDTLIYEITLDSALPLSAGDHITDLDRICSGAVIRNSTFGYNRARGIVLKGSNIVIEGNTIVGTSLAGIVAHADLYWCESGFPNNVTIRNNTLTNIALASEYPTNSSLDMLGAILVTVTPNSGITGFYNNKQNKNITIEGNTINSTRAFGIFALNCTGITIKNNTVSNALSQGIGKLGDLYGISPSGAIFVGMSGDVTVTGNSVSSTGSASSAVQIYSNCDGAITDSDNSKQ